MALAGVAVALAACSPPWSAQPSPPPTPTRTVTETPPEPGLDRFYGQQLDWQPCGGDNECAHLLVPVDYANPDGDTLELSVLRLPARGDRVGSLVVDPGGPGASGTEYAAAGSFVVSDAVLESFDLVGFDPRGVGASAPVECGTDAQIDALIDADGTPDTQAEETRLDTLSREFISACKAPVDGLLDHMSTADAARDMDVLRAALGQQRLDYLGVSPTARTSERRMPRCFPSAWGASCWMGHCPPNSPRKRSRSSRDVASRTPFDVSRPTASSTRTAHSDRARSALTARWPRSRHCSGPWMRTLPRRHMRIVP